MFRNRSADVHQFAMVPRAEIPRSQFVMETAHKTTFDAGYLIPVYLEEILPGDTFQVEMTAFARLATPIFPIMDNMYLESFFFFVPMRLLWTNFVRFMGEQDSPGDSISYTIPQIVSPADGYAIHSLYDYFGLPTVGQVATGETVTHSALPIRAYRLIYTEWFRDQNLIAGGADPMGDGPDLYTAYDLQRRGKRHDYFTSALPFLQKGTAVSLPLSGNAPVITSATEHSTGAATHLRARTTSGGIPVANTNIGLDTSGRVGLMGAGSAPSELIYPTNLYANLSAVTSTTINALRLSIQTQRFLERDARGGTRYTEKVRSHFGVISPDARLQRPEYLGGGSTPVNISPVAQTSNTPATGTPQGNLSAFGTALARRHGFRQSFTEHGYVIGLVNVRADLTYQQGMRRLWSRLTQYDFYFPVFSHLGEQAVLSKEIFCDGTNDDELVFGYQERYGEYRYNPSMITGLFRSTAAGTLDPWHVAQRFVTRPLLNDDFIQEDPPVDRVIAVPSEPHYLLDCFFRAKAARPMPMYSVPGQMDRF